MSVCVAASVQLWCLHEQTVFFPLGTLIYCSGTFAATSMIYLWPGSNESFDTRWMRRTWAASALLCSIGPLSVQSHYDKWCSLLPWRRGSQIFTREVYLNIFNADCISSLVFSFFFKPDSSQPTHFSTMRCCSRIYCVTSTQRLVGTRVNSTLPNALSSVNSWIFNGSILGRSNPGFHFHSAAEWVAFTCVDSVGWTPFFQGLLVQFITSVNRRVHSLDYWFSL